MVWRRPHIARPLVAFVITIALLIAAQSVPAASGASLSNLNWQLAQQQAHQHALANNVGSLSGVIDSLSGQIATVQSHEAAVQADLERDQAALAATQSALGRERALVARLRARLARSRKLLARQLVSSYENDQPDLVAVVLESHGFADLLEKVRFLRTAEHQQQQIIVVTKRAKTRADTETRRLAALEASDREITAATAARAQAIASMDSLLQSKQSALEQARAAQQAALDASRARGGELRGAISRLQAQQAAAQQAAAQQAAHSNSTSSSTSSSPAAPTSSGGWAIPYPIVQCESGGQNLTPNSAGASGYYQIIPSTWKMFGGSGSAAYTASKAEQTAVASRIYAGGAGVSNWDCAKIVGIH